jgi:hypothetical protein
MTGQDPKGEQPALLEEMLGDSVVREYVQFRGAVEVLSVKSTLRSSMFTPLNLLKLFIREQT